MKEVLRRRELRGEVGLLRNRKEILLRLLPERAREFALVSLGFVLGASSLHLYQYKNTYTVSNIVVDSQEGYFVTYHFLYDPSHQQYSFRFCKDRYLPRFQNSQIIAHIKYVRSFDSKGGCEDLSPSSTELRLLRVNGIPVVEAQK